MMARQPRIANRAALIGLIALTFSAAVVSAARQSHGTAISSSRSVGAPEPAPAFISRRRPNKAKPRDHLPASGTKKAREFGERARAKRIKQQNFAIRGGSQFNEGDSAHDASADAASDGGSSESDGYETAAMDDDIDSYDSSSTGDDAYGETYDHEEAEIIEGYYNQEGRDCPAAADVDCSVADTGATDTDNLDGGSSTKGAATHATAPETTEKSATDPPPSSLAKHVPPEIRTKRSSASDLRVAGVEHHHSGDLTSAADVFLKAATELEAAIQIFEDLPQQEQEQSELAEMVEEAATCRLHEALCHLKQQKYADCIQSCTSVLEDGVQVVPFDDADTDGDVPTEEEDGESGLSDLEHGGAAKKRAAVIRVTPTGGAGGSIATARTNRPRISAAARARAYHRRAKARLALQDISGATEDAKEAAYLGDRNAVSLYGRILREHSPGGGADSGGGMGGTSAGALADMLGGNNPFLSALTGSGDPSGSSDPSSALLSSLLGSGAGSASGNGMGPFGGLGSLLGANGAGTVADNNAGGKSKRRRNRKVRGNDTGGGGMDSLAKSLLKNLAKRIDDDKTQSQICNFCQGANTGQVKMYAGMAGMQLPDATADRIVAVANGVTKRKLKRVVRLARRGISAVKITSKVVKVLQKYKHLFILVLICGWAKSSWLRDAPVNRRAIKRAAKEAAKVAAIKGTEAAVAAVAAAAP
mmetsp:Transcript_18463/g.52980  ORF Transcript_18463/g.52980 Transcript_18463/m.52980 type:complete len:704 (-) Transcript_18463:164-2275(-)